MKMKITVEQAEQLWLQLRTGLLAAQGAIDQIIQTRAWEPLGFKSLHDAWSDRMGDITMPSAALISVVYQMLAEDVSDDDIADVVKGVGPGVVAGLRRQRDNGMPSQMAKLQGRIPRRGHGGVCGTVFLQVGPDKLVEWARIAAQRDMSVMEFALPVLERAFRRADASR